MNFQNMTTEEMTFFFQDLTKTKGKVLEFLKTIREDVYVYAYCQNKKTYTNRLDVWVEGHEYRHFIEIEVDDEKSPMTVRALIDELSKAYNEKSESYASTVCVNVHNTKGQMTANFDFELKEDGIYFIGKKPMYEYYDEYRKAN